MKKYIYSGWIKLLAVLLVLISVPGTIVNIIGAVFTSVCDYQEVSSEINRNLLSQMSVGILEDEAWNSEASAEADAGNMVYAVVRSTQDNLEDVDLEDDSVYLYRSPGYDGTYQEAFLGGYEGHYTGYRYDENKLFASLSRRVEYVEDNWQRDYISRIVMDVDTGILYCKSYYGYYIVEEFLIYDPDDIMPEYDNYDNFELASEGNAQYYIHADSWEPIDLRDYVTKNVWIVLGEEGSMIRFSPYLIKAVEGQDSLTSLTEATDVYEDGWDYCEYGILPADAKTISAGLVQVTDSYLSGEHVYYTSQEENTHYWVLSSVNEEYPSRDLLSRANGILTRVYAFKNWYVFLGLVNLAVFILAMVYLLKAAGRRAGTEEIRLRWVDRIPYSIWLVCIWTLILCAACLFTAAIGEECYYIGDQLFAVMEVLLSDTVILAALWFVLGTAARIKSGKFFRYTLLYYIWKPIRGLGRAIRAGMREIRSNLSFFVKLILAIAAWNLVELFILMIVWNSWWLEEFLVTVFFLKIVEIALVIVAGLQMKRLQDGSAKIAAGNTAPIDTKGLFWEFKKHGENINKVGDGISAAVAEQMKSERFRTELITNVSHDIKTPLTSIINYVDLMKKLDIKDPTMLEYMDVLDRQSARLKKLIEDLMEASKASTGNLEVLLEKCDISVLFVQMVGEFEEKARKAQLDFVVSGSQAPIYIMADGRHIWRVFDNLLNNACKYAMPGTRVYIDLVSKDDHVEITFKNISKTQLNISSEELMERFVRGDSSRNTEGSGLGLSIAQSLTELMSGTMALSVDGDLFKVTLSFPICEENAAEQPLC